MKLLSRNRSFEKEALADDAKKIFIFCEGAGTEKKYFQCFQNIDSRINIEVYELDETEDNSPKGLLNIAEKCILETKENPNPKYDDVREQDEIWIVLDTDIDKADSRKPQILNIKEVIKERPNWNLVQSNPCFELWLWFHIHENKPPAFENDAISRNWKRYVNQNIMGGFDPRKHPFYIKDAIRNAKQNFESEADRTPKNRSTDVFRLGENVYTILKEKIERALKL